MKTFTKLTLILLALTISAFASTVTITFNTLPGATANGYYVGYSGATVNNGTTIFDNFDLICDDFSHTTNIPSGPFTYTTETLDNLSGARFTTNQLNNYKVAAVLLYQFDQNLGTVDPGGYNFALWKLFTPSAGDFGDSATLLANAQSIVNAGGGITTAAYKNMVIFTPTQANASQQEFLGITTPGLTSGSPVPEPSTFGLLGLGLIGFGYIRKRK